MRRRRRWGSPKTKKKQREMPLHSSNWFGGASRALDLLPFQFSNSDMKRYQGNSDNGLADQMGQEGEKKKKKRLGRKMRA